MPGSDDEDVLGGDVSMDEDVSMEEDDDGDAADDEDEHDGADVAGTRRGSAQKKQRRPREVMPLFGVKRSKASKRDVKHPEKNAAERAQVYARPSSVAHQRAQSRQCQHQRGRARAIRCSAQQPQLIHFQGPPPTPTTAGSSLNREVAAQISMRLQPLHNL